MSKLDDIKAFVAVNPGSRWWIEELLIRGAIDPTGQQGGIITGSHITVGVQFTGADGTTQRRIFGPYPIGSLPSEVPMGKVLTAFEIAQQNAIDSHATEIAAKDATHADALAAKDAAYAALQQRLGELLGILDLVGGEEAGKAIALDARRRRIAEAEAALAAEKAAIAAQENPAP